MALSTGNLRELATISAMRTYSALRSTLQRIKHHGARNDLGSEVVSFACKENARAVSEHANCMLYEFLLSELTVALKREGYEMSRDSSLKTALPKEVLARVGNYIMLKREYFMAPRQKESSIRGSVSSLYNSGFTHTWLSALLQSCEAQGWYITATQNDNSISAWQEYVCPRKQVTVSLSAGQYSITRDVVRCLNHIANELRMVTFPEFGGIDKKEDVFGYTGLTGVQRACNYSRVYQHSAELQGFFPDGVGCRLPPVLQEKRLQTLQSPERYVTVIVQGIRDTSTETLAYNLTEAIQRIEVGEYEGASYGDQVGYAFINEYPPLLSHFI